MPFRVEDLTGQESGFYPSRARAAYWLGPEMRIGTAENAHGEPVNYACCLIAYFKNVTKAAAASVHLITRCPESNFQALFLSAFYKK